MMLFVDETREAPAEVGWIVARRIEDAKMLIMSYSISKMMIGRTLEDGAGSDLLHWLTKMRAKGRIKGKLIIEALDEDKDLKKLIKGTD